jgi:O-antigen/teichoic acid export membrane protein
MATVVSVVICIPVFGLATSGLSALLNPVYALLFLVFALMNSVVAITGNAFIAMRRGGQYLIQNAVIAARIPLLIPLVFLGGYGIFSSVGLAYLIAAVLALIVMHRSIGVDFRVDKPFLRKSLSFSLGSYASNILSSAPVLVMPILVLGLAGEAEAAKYFIAFAVGHLVLIIPDSFSTTLFVEGSHGESLKRTVKTAAIATYGLLIPAIILISLFGGTLLGLIGDEYQEASQLLTLIALSAVAYTVCALFISIQNVRMKVASVVRINVLRSSLLLGSSCYFVFAYGIIGVGYAWLLTYGTICIVIGVIARKENWI